VWVVVCMCVCVRSGVTALRIISALLLASCAISHFLASLSHAMPAAPTTSVSATFPNYITAFFFHRCYLGKVNVSGSRGVEDKAVSPGELKDRKLRYLRSKG
jgi:hypothetical protein